MRNVIFAINVTLDGCCDHTKMIADEELLEHYTRLVQEADLFVYGRKTYQLMVPYWPDIAKSHSETKAENEFADAFVFAKKVVFSRTLDSAEDKNTRIVRTDLRDEILKLKQEPGKNILAGGVDIRLIMPFAHLVLLSVPSHRRHRFQQKKTPTPIKTADSFQSPLHRGTGFNFSLDFFGNFDDSGFQSPLHRGTGFNADPAEAATAN